MPLSLLLREAGVQQGATWIVAEGADATGNERSIPMAKAMDDVLVAYGQNGEALRPENGYPLRLIVPGWTGNINVKWLRRLTVVDRPYLTRMDGVGQPTLMPDGKARQLQFVMEAKSVITFPSGGQQLPGPGFYEITGLAWSGRGLVRRVEVSTDGGQDLAGRSPPGTGPPLRPHALPARLAMGRARGRPPVAVHRRDRLCPADAGRAGQGPRPELDLLQQRHPELEGGGRRERPQCPRLGCWRSAGIVVLIVAGRRLAGRGPAADLRRGPPAHRRGGPGLGSHHPARWPGLAAGQRDRRARPGDLRGAVRRVPRREGRGPEVQPPRRRPGTLATDKPIRTIGSFWQYATTLWSYIRRAQPFDEPGSLTPDQVYAVTAYLLHLNGIIGEQDVMDATDPAAGQDAEPRRVRPRPTARCGAGIATTEALGRSWGQWAKRIALISSLWLCWVERRQTFLYRDTAETLIRTNKMVEDTASSEV